MITGPIIAETAALVGDPARATMVSALVDGRTLTASELAAAARVTPQTASTHLAKLTAAGVAVGGPEGATSLFPAGLADRGPHDRRDRRRRPRARDRDTARYPFKHARSVRPGCATTTLRAASASISPILSSLIEYIVLDDEMAEITTAGTRGLTEFGIKLPTVR